jgi:hypothetical protein
MNNPEVLWGWRGQVIHFLPPKKKKFSTDNITCSNKDFRPSSGAGLLIYN